MLPPREGARGKKILRKCKCAFQHLLLKFLLSGVTEWYTKHDYLTAYSFPLITKNPKDPFLSLPGPPLLTKKDSFYLHNLISLLHPICRPLKTLGFYKKIPLKDYSSRGISSDSKGNRTPKKTLKPA